MARQSPMMGKLQSAWDFLYTDLYFTIGYSTVIGLGNAIASSSKGGNFNHAFGEGFVNNAMAGIVVNAVYPLVFSKVENSRHFRAYAHALNVSLNAGFLAWHYYIGTENPLAANAPAFAIGALMTEQVVGKISSEKKAAKAAGLEAKVH